MIAKRIMRGKASDFGKLGDYIINGKTKAAKSQLVLGALVERKMGQEAAIWQRTADYIVDALEGRRASAVRITNCSIDDLDLAIAEIIATQQMNRRAKGDRTYHLVVSFPPGETPSLEQLCDIENELCGAIGLGKHQRISAVHADTQHLHMHIAINQVHPETFACIEPWQDRPKLMRACDRLEIKHGLIRTNHSKVRVEALQPELVASIDTPGLDSPSAAPSTAPDRAVAMERYGGLETLLGWVRREAKPALLAAVNTGAGWADLHAALAAHGLEIRRRGAGLIITSGKTAIKASDVDRLLSLKALQGKWGSFVRADPQQVALVPVKQQYRRGPMHRDVDELFEDWRRDCEINNAAFEKLSEEMHVWVRWIKEYKDVCIEGIHRLPLTAQGRNSQYQELDRELQARWREKNAQMEARRTELRREHRASSWPEFLRDAASKGNAAALRALRRNAQRYRQAVNAAVQPGSQTDETVIRELKPETRADGTVVYSLRDGGKLVDDGRKPVVQKDSPIARALTLTLLASRARNGEVAVEHDEARAFIEAAAREKLQLRFRDAEHERERLRLIPVFEREAAALAAAVFIAAGNAARASQPDQPDQPRLRLWQSSDAGNALYEGAEDLGEGASAILLRKGKEVLVLPQTASETAFNAAPGTAVDITAQGQISNAKGMTR